MPFDKRLFTAAYKVSLELDPVGSLFSVIQKFWGMEHGAVSVTTAH